MLMHGSNKFIEKEIKPHTSFHYKPYVYATTDIFYALVRAGNFNTDEFLLKEDYDGKTYTLIELEHGAFEKVFDTKGYIYKVDESRFFQNNACMPNEYISENSCEILGFAYIDNVLKMIKSFPSKYKLVHYENSAEYWKTVRGGKEGYLQRRKDRVEKLKTKVPKNTKQGGIGMKYRKKPVVIEAFQYDGDLMNSNGEYYVPEWAVSAFESDVMYYDSLEPNSPPCELFIKTLEGNHHVSVGDYVIQGVNGELYPCKPDIFLKTYELVS